MDHDAQHHGSGTKPVLSRRTLLRHTMAAGLTLAGGTGLAELAEAASPAESLASGGELRPVDAIQAVFTAMKQFPLVGLGERHMLQEMHDFITALLFHPDLPHTLTDIVVEFGNSSYQDLADRFVLGDQPVARADLVQIWRQVGDPAWNAPIYEQFFRTVRAINWMRPASRRIRVLLGQPPVTMSQVIARPTNRALFDTLAGTMDDHYAAVIEQEVLRKGRRALLIAGSGHLLRGIRADDGKPHHLNAASQVLLRYPNTLYVVDLFVLPPSGGSNPMPPQVQDEVQRAAAKFAGWPRPAIAAVAGTWLGSTTEQNNPWINGLAYRALNAAAARFGAQADAILYLGPGEALTASQPDPSIYYWGAYPRQLRQVDTIFSRVTGQSSDQLSYGIRWATDQPSWFALFG